MLKNFEGVNYRKEKNNHKSITITSEGAAAVDNAITFLQKQEALPPLKWSADMAMVAKDHVMDIGPRGLIQHDSSNGESVKERFRKYGKFLGCYGESLAFNCDTAEEVIS